LENDIPIILTGDFNAEPDSNTVKYFYENGFVDSWSLYNNNKHDHGYTFSSNGMYRKRIDFILIKSKIDFKIHNFEIFGKLNYSNLEIYPSDHSGIFLNISFYK
jgi:maltose 6'-phosphate phosphatase